MTFFELSLSFEKALILGLIVGAAFWVSRKRLPSNNDPYGLFHLSLNRLHGDDTSLAPKTEWLNMGYWKDARTFPQACEALAVKLALKSRLLPGGSVLDVGHGTGDSLLLLLSHPSIPRPSSLTGVTSLATHSSRAQFRVNKVVSQSDGPASLTKVSLYSGDAVTHSLEGLNKRYDTILALDCAYHFNTRSKFLLHSFRRLHPGGRIGLADICFASSAFENLRKRLTVKLLRLMPSPNIVSTSQYVQDMRDLGYVDVELEDISEDVFPGFLEFLKSRGGGWWMFSILMEWYTWAGARFVLVTATRPESETCD